MKSRKLYLTWGSDFLWSEDGGSTGFFSFFFFFLIPAPPQACGTAEEGYFEEKVGIS